MLGLKEPLRGRDWSGNGSRLTGGPEVAGDKSRDYAVAADAGDILPVVTAGDAVDKK
ncbi:MAG: hypothetical protein JEY99_09400 [Spirochaetales bacterium]|nr:hypothetical protein [Spirochaetales bacterium]